jgi:hypothetical protein
MTPTPPPSTQARPRPSRLETFRPITLKPSTWPTLLRDDHPVGNILGFGRG